MTWPTASIGTTNVDAGSDSPATARADINTALAQINSIRNYFDDAESTITISGGGAIDIGGAATNRIKISGVGGGITSFGTSYNGPVFVRTVIGCSIVYNATTLVTPSATSLTLAVDDAFIAWPKGSASDGWFVFPMRGAGQLALNGAAIDPNATLTLGRINTTAEGGQMSLCRSSDNAAAYGLDTFLDPTTSRHVFRIIDVINSRVLMWIDPSNGYVAFGQNAAPASPFDFAADRLRIATSKSPASGATGVAGEIAWDASYVYVCTATNTWKRAALTGGY